MTQCARIDRRASGSGARARKKRLSHGRESRVAHENINSADGKVATISGHSTRGCSERRHTITTNQLVKTATSQPRECAK